MTEPTSQVQKSSNNKTILIVIAIVGFVVLCMCCMLFTIMIIAINPAQQTSTKNNVVEEFISPTDYIDEEDLDFRKYSFGEIMKFDTHEINLINYDEQYSIDDLNLMTDSQKVVSVEVQITNIGSQSYGYSDYDFVVKDVNDIVYYPSNLALKEQVLSAGVLLPGELTTGWISYVVPENLGLFTLEYIDYLSGGRALVYLP